MSTEMTPTQPTPPDATPAGQFSIPKDWNVAAGIGSFLSSYNARDKTERRQLLRALNEDAQDPAKLVNTTFSVVHVVMHPIQFPDERTGEVIDSVRTVLILKDGTRVAFGSTTVIKSLMLIMNLESPPPWPYGLPLKLERIPTRNDKSFYRLSIVDDAPPPAEAAVKPKR